MVPVEVWYPSSFMIYDGDELVYVLRVGNRKFGLEFDRTCAIRTEESEDSRCVDNSTSTVVFLIYRTAV